MAIKHTLSDSVVTAGRDGAHALKGKASDEHHCFLRRHKAWKLGSQTLVAVTGCNGMGLACVKASL